MPLFVIPFPAFDPVLVHIGPFAIRWYALAYIVGILLGWVYARALIRSERLWGGPAPMTVVDFDDFMLWVTLGIILGGRIGYVLFYNLPHFAAHPLEILQLWKGGMSFHGGFIGCVVAVRAVRVQARHSDPVARRHHLRGRADRAVPWAASPISSTANCGAGRPTCRGPWCFPAAGRCRVIQVSSMRRRSKAWCCSRCWPLLMRAGALKRPGLIIGAFADRLRRRAHHPANSSASPMRSSASCGAA